MTPARFARASPVTAGHMYSRLIVPLLCASALVFACGPLSRSAEVPPGDLAAADTTFRDLAASLDVAVGREIQFALRVTNATEKRLELSFPDGQTHELVILDAAGREVWRWSRDRMFTSAVQTKLLGAGETTGYTESWTPPEGAAGSFTAIASLRSSNNPVELRHGFTLP